MSNRHTKRKRYTQRQIKSIENMRERIMNILEETSSPKHSDKAFKYLLNAYDKLEFALDANKVWIEGDES